MKAFPDVEKGLISFPRLTKFNSRLVQGAILVILFVFLIHSLNSLNGARQAGHGILEHYHDTMSKVTGIKSKTPGMARPLYQEELMQRPLATDLISIARYSHQSWMKGTLPNQIRVMERIGPEGPSRLGMDFLD